MTITPNPRQPLDEQSLALLEREASTWVARGLITQDQASGILAGYEPVPATTIGHWLQGHLIAALAILGVVLVGLGVLLFIGANWQSIGKEIKLGLLFVGLSATYGGGYWAAGPMKMPRVGTALILLGAILYGAAIFLIAQMYHVRAGSPSLLLWWSLGVLPLAYAVRSRAVLVLGIGASLVTLLWYDVLWLRNTDDAPQRVIAFAAVIGATFLALAMVKRRVRHLAWSAPVPATLGLALMLGALYVFTFRGLFDEGLFRPREMSWQFALAFHLSAAVAVVSLAGTLLQESFARRPDRLLVSTVLAAALLMVGGAYLVLFAPFESSAFYAILFNAVLAAVIIGLIVGGYLRSIPASVNLGILLALVDIATRYFDFAWRLLDRSLVFIVGGLVLLAFGFVLERLRRRVVAGMAERGGRR